MSIAHVNVPPKKATGPFVVPQLEGEQLSIPGSRSVFRIITPQNQPGDTTIAVFTSGGVVADPPGFHHHEEAHDVFLVTRGYLQLWVDKDCKVLGPGDFAYVPPHVVHNPKLLGPHTEMLGLVSPEEWVDFFRTVSDQHSGVLFPEYDDRHIFSSIMPRIKGSGKQFDVHFHPEWKGAEVSEWTGGANEQVPDSQGAYYLRSNTGSRWLLGNVMSRPFVTTKQTSGKFAISSIEGSSKLGKTALDGRMTFTGHHCLSVQEGALEVRTRDDDKRDVLHEGESVWVPAGSAFSVSFKSKFCRVFSFCTGKGMNALIEESAGTPCKNIVLPDTASEWSTDRVSQAAQHIGAKYDL